MSIKNILPYFWKLPLCGIVFFTGMALSGVILPALGFQSPEMPAGTDANTIALWFVLGSMLLTFVLSFVARNLHVNWLARWLLLSIFMWVFAVVGMVVESFFFMDSGAVSSLENSLFTVLSFTLPILFLSAMVVALFRPEASSERNSSRFFGTRKWHHWLWRGLVALAAYPLIYFSMGLMVLPFIRQYYASGQYELVNPTWGQLIPLQSGRSALFLLASLPVIIWWGSSRRSLWLALGFSIAVLTGFMAVITSYWFPWQMRLFHGVELLVDGLLYAAVLVWLFARNHAAQNEKITQ